MLTPACSGNGTLALRLTDAPPDLGNIQSAVVTLAAAEAHFAGDGDDKTDEKPDGDVDEGGHGGWVRVTGAPSSYDLLRLQNGVSELIGEIGLPDGKITQLRLFIDETGPNQVTLKSGQICALDLKDVDKTGIKIVHPFKALSLEHGQRLEVVIDFDLAESVQQDGPCAYRLTPVIKIKSAHL
jgi:hypothetical protein